MRAIVLFMAILPYFCVAQIKYSINGDIEELRSHDKIYLIFDNNKDSAIIEDGKFKFVGTVDRPTLVTLGFFDTTINNSLVPPRLLSFRQFYLSTSRISIKGGTLNNAIIEADKLNSIYAKYWLESDSLRTAGIQRDKEYFKKINQETLSNEDANKHQEQFQDFIREYQAFDLYFLENNELSQFSVDLIDRYLNQYNVLKLTELYEKILPTDIDTIQDKRIKSKIISLSRLAVGAEAPSFMLLDTLGKEISLEQLRGKTILLEFWASWCIPCRKENPVYLDIYNMYKDRGFEIVAISFNKDNEKAEWLKAIRDDKTQEWTHLSDLKGYQSPIYKLYEIGGLPQSYLLDRNGVIVGHNLKGKELQDKLKLILK